jgi:hypothetical protein
LSNKVTAGHQIPEGGVWVWRGISKEWRRIWEADYFAERKSKRQRYSFNSIYYMHLNRLYASQ